MNSIKYILILLFVVSCKKEKVSDEEDFNSNQLKNGILVLNEGLFQQNNATLSWIDFEKETVKQNMFLEKNDRLLGDTGNDLKRYGGKIYIVVNASSTVEVINPKNLKSIKQIGLNYNGQGQQPRSIDFWRNKAYVTSYDGYVNIIDTTSLSVVDRIKVGQNPEDLAILSDYLYVTNSGGLNFPAVDSTVFKIDLSNNTVTDTFTVGNNPGDIISHDNNLFLVKRGDYENDPSELVKINVNTGEITNLEIFASTLSKKNDDLYISYYDYNTSASNVDVYNMSSNQLVNSSSIDESKVTTLYGAFPFENQKIICTDAMNFTNTGFIKIFNSNGLLENSFEVGLNPNNIIIYE
ncbi:MAG: YncE family protein [Brumimicrobium sp.]